MNKQQKKDVFTHIQGPFGENNTCRLRVNDIHIWRTKFYSDKKFSDNFIKKANGTPIELVTYNENENTNLLKTIILESVKDLTRKIAIITMSLTFNRCKLAISCPVLSASMRVFKPQDIGN